MIFFRGESHPEYKGKKKKRSRRGGRQQRQKLRNWENKNGRRGGAYFSRRTSGAKEEMCGGHAEIQKAKKYIEGENPFKQEVKKGGGVSCTK